MKTAASVLCVFLVGELVAPAPGRTQGVVTGIITDTLGQPIPALVAVEANTGTVADRSGVYLLRLAAGAYELEVSSLGFETERSGRVEVSAGDTTIRHFVLIPSPPPQGVVWLGCALEGLPGDAVCLNPSRVSARSLWVEEPGQWVIQSETEWKDFRERYGGTVQGMEPPGEPAAINWDLNRLVVVGWGRTSGCENWRRRVNRILLYRDSTVVYVGPDRGSGELTCAAIIAPVDVVLIPRGYGSVRFRNVKRQDG